MVASSPSATGRWNCLDGILEILPPAEEAEFTLPLCTTRPACRRARLDRVLGLRITSHEVKDCLAEWRATCSVEAVASLLLVL